MASNFQYWRLGMATSMDRFCVLAATALVPGTAACTALAAGTTGTAVGLSAEASKEATASGVIDHIVELSQKDELIRAEAMIADFLAGPASVTLSDAESRRIFELQRDVLRRVRQADPNDLSVQRGRLALAQEDLASAEQHARAVLASSMATESQRIGANGLLSVIDISRSALAPHVDSRLAGAVEAFDAGAYDLAERAFSRIARSGLTLTPAQREIVSSHQARLRSVNAGTGTYASSFAVDAPATLSTLQPGVANRTDWNRASAGDAGSSDASGTGSESDTAMMQPAADPAGSATDAPQEDLLMTARRLQAESTLAEADAAWQNGRYTDASRLYREVIDLGAGLLPAETLARAQANLTEAEVVLRGNLPSGNLLGDGINTRSIARQATDAEFANAIEQAKSALASGDIPQARNAAATAKLALSNGRDLYDIATYEAKLSEADDLLIRIAEAEERMQVRGREDAIRQADSAAEKTRLQRARETDAKIIGFIESVRAHQLERNYEKALQEVEQILFLDPNNAAGLLLRDVLTDTILLQDYEDASSRRRPSYVRELVDNWEATIAPSDIINYPADWKNISQRRGDPMQFSESAVNRAVLSSLEDKRIPVDFSDNNLEDVLSFVAQVANIEMDIDWPALEDIGVNPETPVSLRLTSVPLDTVLDRVLDKASTPDFPAGWAVTDGVLTIASDEVLRRNTVLEIYDIRDLLIEIPDYDQAPQFDLNTVFQQAGQQGGGGGGQSPFQVNQQQLNDQYDRDALVEDIRNLIQENIDREGWVDFGGETGTITELNGNLVIVNTPKNHRQITGLLSKLRAVRNLQINVESRFLLINEDYFEQIGLDLDVYFANNNEYDTLRTIDPTLLPEDFFSRDAAGNLTINRAVSGGNFFDTDGDGVLDTPIGQPVFQPGSNGDSFSPIQGEQNSLGLTKGLAGGSFASDIFSLISGTNGGPALSVAGRFLDDIQVDFLVEATQADRSSMTLTAPRLTLSNGQLSYTFVGSQQTFVSDLQPVVSNAAVAFDPQIGVVPDGVRLVVRGVISADRRYVTLDVTTDVASTTLSATQTSQAAAGGTGNIAGSGIATGTIQLPTVTITRVQTTVTVPDQGTLLMGGQRVVNEYITETGVPVLSKVPILNRFFTNRIETKEEQTLLILIKPTVLIQNEEEEKNFPGLLDTLGY